MGNTINPHGKKIIKVETEFCGRKLSLEVNRVGFRTSASVLVRYGDTVVLGSAMVSDKSVQGFDYFPLSIDYEEKMYASGKISGSRFIKREGRPSDDAILIGRLIDRPIRPLWPKGYRHEVQGVATVLSMDPDFRPDMIAMIAMSSAFMLTGAPFEGPVAGVRVGLVNGKPQAFMSPTDMDSNELDLVVAGTKDAIMMVEAGANEVSEDIIIEALQFAQKAILPAIQVQNELVKAVGVSPQEYSLVLPDQDIQKRVDTWLEGKLGVGLRAPYPERNDLVKALRQQMIEHFTEELGEDFADYQQEYDDAFVMAIHKDVRKGIIAENIRPDGRALTEIRTLSSEVGLLPRAHGSSLFTRGMTQALNVVTLAPLSYAQLVDTMEKEGERRFFHHYNAPGYTVGEVRRLGSPGRREIGHGALAERALVPVLPTREEFPYAIRQVSEALGSNGSTSMGSVCASTMSLLNAGVPLKAPVAGIAMGLISDEVDGKTEYVALTDILGAEDAFGDMDFKVAGTKDFVTALQLDTKLDGIPASVLAGALHQAKEARLAILDVMNEAIDTPDEMSQYAPRIISVKIPVDQIGAVIGPKGKIINQIQDETGAEISIEEDGTIYIGATDGPSAEAARAQINAIANPQMPEVGERYLGTVVKLATFGAFVSLMPGKDGLLHVSQIRKLHGGKRIENLEDVMKVGDKIQVEIGEIDPKGKLSLVPVLEDGTTPAAE
mgnify:CR=1 FL=1